jgi:uncharacterized protein YggE
MLMEEGKMMIMRWIAPVFFAAALTASAQEAGHSTVTVTASGKIEKTATALQFTFQITAKGDDVAKAAEALEGKRKAALERLKALGVAEKEVVVTVPAVEKKDPNQARMMRQARPSNRLKKKKEDEKPEKEPVVVGTSVTARLPLQGKEAAALFVESEQLKEKVKAAKLFEKDKKEEGEGDEDEEMNARMMQYQEQQGLEDGFLFQFYAPSDSKDLDAAAAKAMESAKTLAEAGARASGRTLTGPTGVEISDSGSRSSQMEEYYYYQRRRGATPSAPAAGGIVSPSLEGLEATVVLKVTFGLK